jgi:hypothetical protein
MCDMADSDDDHGRSRRPGAEDQRWSSTGRVHGGRLIRRLGDDVCGLYLAQGDKEREFFSLGTKPRSTVSLGLASKLVASGFSVWASNPLASVW